MRTYTRVNTPERFWLLVNKNGDYWEWNGPKNDRGYGHFTIKSVGEVIAHRVSFTLTNGAIPDGLMICHRCNKPGCVNPAHLYAGTARENTRDMVISGRSVGKLKPHQVLQIRARFDAGERPDSIAPQFGVCVGSIRLIGRRKTYACLAEVGR